MRFLSTLAASVLGTLIALGVIVFFLFFFVFALTLSGDQQPTVSSGSVLVVPLDGPIPERSADDPFGQAFGGGADYDLRDLQTALRTAASDDRIRAAWLKVESAPLGWATLEEVRAAVERFRESGKPVFASSADFGMSEKAYFAASAADSVFAGPNSPFVLNGFELQQPFFEGALQRLDVEPKIVRVGQYKSAVEPYLRSGFSEPNREQLSALLNTINETFKQGVSDRRGVPADSLEAYADARPILGSEVARERGLLDGLRYRDEVTAALRAALGLADGADVPTVDLSDYARVPASAGNITYTGEGHVAIVYAEGAILPGEADEAPVGSGQPTIGSETFVEAMNRARESSQAKAVVLRVNSPGGAAQAAEAMWRAVDRTAQEKPVIVSMGDAAASGGYYIAAAGDSILANPTTITGSIGVFARLFNAEGLFENKLGVTFDDVETSPYADIYSLVEPFSDQERSLLQQSIDRSYSVFVDRVAEGRGMPAAEVRNVAQGRVWAGQDARDVGLVDSLGGLEDAIEIAGREGGLGDGPYRTRVLPRPKTFLERFNERLAGQAARLWTRWTTSPAERMVRNRMQLLERALGAHGRPQARLPFDVKVE
jgi:protease-4